MEYINKVQLRGIVGRVDLKQVGDKKMARFSVLTCRAYKSRDGQATVDQTWHNVTAFESRAIEPEELEQIQKGSHVELWGRINVNRYEGQDGEPRVVTEIICSNLKLLPNTETMAYEM